MAPGFAHLHVHSPFSFLDGASRIEDLVRRAAELGQRALALTDHNNLSGAVRFTRAAREAGVKPILGVEITMAGGYHLTLLARNRQGYRSLCRLLTRAHLGSPRGRPSVTWEDLAAYRDGLVALSGCRRGEVSALILKGRLAEAEAAARRLRNIFGRDGFYLELIPNLLPGDRALHRALADLGRALNLRLVATANVHYARKEDFHLHDLLTCVRTQTTVSAIHPERPLNAENYLKAAGELAVLLPEECREALTQAGILAASLEPSLPEDEPLFPRFPVPPGETAEGMLRRLAWEGARRRYGRLSAALQERVEKELGIICRLGFADYFLVLWDIVREARARGIRCAGRGSAADSVVAYCLGITEVDAFRRELLFERFLSAERAERPDIDLDIDARYRDELAAYLRCRYGEDKVAAVATYQTFQARSAVRDLGKALEIPAEELDALARRLPYFVPADGIRAARARVPELKNTFLPWERYERLLDFCAAAAGLPRHLGTHLGGLVVAREPLADLVPLQWAAKGTVVAQFDKDDVEDLGLVKLDLLSLRTLSAVEETLKALKESGRPLDYDRLPLNDRATFQMLRRAETIGVFQLESPAQRALQGRLGADNMEDLVASLALIRPGPIKGNMVEPFITRRRGEEPVSYPYPTLEPILKKTYGVVLFQEQVIAIATAIAGFSAGEADRLRRVMTHARSQAEMTAIGEEFVARAVERGVPLATAQAIFDMIAGYASYGFCEAHAAAFATTAYKTAYLLRHYAAYYLAALLTCQPMGFYPPWVLIGEARRRGVKVLPPDVNKSGAAYTVEGDAIRVSLRQVKGVEEKALKALIAARASGPFTSLADLKRRVNLPADVRENLILAGACASLGSNRRALLWEDKLGRAAPGVPDFSPTEKILFEWDLLGFSLSGHPISCLRPHLSRQGILMIREAKHLPPGREVKVAGLPIRPHRPPTKSGRTVAFFSVEDETGLIDVTVFEDVYQRYGHLLFGDAVSGLLVCGRLEKRGNLASITALAIEELGGRPTRIPVLS